MPLAEPARLGLLFLAILPWLWETRRARVSWPVLDGFTGVRSWPARLLGSVSPILRGLAIASLVVALARPREEGGRIRVAGQGVTILAVLDRSSSMKTVDFPSPGGPVARLEAARATLTRFVEGRGDDLVGLVAFANYPDLLAAPSLNQRFVLEALAAVQPAGASDDGTNLGDALAWSLAAVRSATTRRTVLVLLTDGRNAPSVPRPVDPLEAARIARGVGVTLHVVAIGKPPSDPPSPESGENSGPDLPLLGQMAEQGGGKLFVATDQDALERIFHEIDALEKSPVTGTIRILYKEAFAPFAAAALGLLALDLLVRAGRARRLP